MFKFKFVAFIIILTALTLGAFIRVGMADAATQLLRSAEFGTVYFVDEQGVRHAFPNEATYKSWYGNDFSQVATVSAAILAQYPLGDNITVRPGTYLVKLRTSPKTYAVATGGVLRELHSEEVAELLYGPNWAARVIDVADVFFDNYELGEVIDTEQDIPEGSIIQQNTGTYYFLERNILQPFSSYRAVEQNKFDTDFAIRSERSYYKRTRVIDGFDASVFNPVAAPLVKNYDCRARDLRAAVLFISTGSPSFDEIDTVQHIKDEISTRWSWATYELSSIDVSYPLIVFEDDGEMLQRRADGSYEIRNEAISTFYEKHSDVFDFLLVYTDFPVVPTDSNEIASFVRVTNRETGTGVGRRTAGEIYGSSGRLKGIAIMGDVSQYEVDTEHAMNISQNLVLHELLHHWGAAATFIDPVTGESSKALLRSPDFGHWTNFAGWISPLGGQGWRDNGDGTFTSLLSQLEDPNLRPFSPLDLYLMGLIPRQLMDPIYYVEPADPSVAGNTIEATAHWVEVEQIISDIGKIGCVQ